MSAKDVISPFLNRLVDLLYKKSTAKVELSCQDGQLKISMFHEHGVIEEATPEAQHRMPSYNKVARNTFTKRDAGNAILNTWSRTASPNILLCKKPTRVSLQS